MQKPEAKVATFRRAWFLALFCMVLMMAWSAPALAQKEHKHRRGQENASADEKAHKHKDKGEKAPSVADLWNDPGDIKGRDLFDGPGGKEHEPHGPMTFVEEDTKGSNPKFDLKDGNGETWKAKVGVEAQPETAAVRLLWAVGYFADDDYFLPQLQVKGMPQLKRGGNVADPNGTVRNVRLKYRAAKKEGTWKWDHNPFTGTREMNGLRVMMALVNNWDLKDENNAIYKEKDDGRRIYLVSDVGASFGRTGYHYYGGWSKNDAAAYAHSKFISHIHKDSVDFNEPTHPPFIYVFGLIRWARHLHERGTTKHIPRADAKWIGGLLAQLTPEQINDAFRAAGYNDAQIAVLAGALRDRIAQLNRL
ncbi:MAG TPA: hypothetical protein VE998_06075 [Terriglobales bacterium]|nr:hypothetical protein [Terriglobales bacterium]